MMPSIREVVDAKQDRLVVEGRAIPSEGAGEAVVRGVVELLGAVGAAFLPLRSGLVGASDAAVHGPAGDRCLEILARRNLALPGAPAGGVGCAALPFPRGADGSSQLWLAAAYDDSNRPTALLSAEFTASADRTAPLLAQSLREALAAVPRIDRWTAEVEVLSHSGLASNLLATAISTAEEILFVTPALGEVLGMVGLQVGRAVVDLTHGDAVVGRLRALANGMADPVGVLQPVSRLALGDGTVVVCLREIEQARLDRQIQSFATRNRLTVAERAALQDIAKGLSAKESAQRLGLSPETVRARRKRIFRKVGADGCGTVMAQLLGTASEAKAPRA